MGSSFWADTNGSTNSCLCLQALLNLLRENETSDGVEMVFSMSAFAYLNPFYYYTKHATQKLMKVMGLSEPLPPKVVEMPGVMRCSSHNPTGNELFSPENKNEPGLLRENGHRIAFGMNRGSCQQFIGELLAKMTFLMSLEYATRANTPCSKADRFSMLELSPFTFLALWFLFDGEFAVLLGDGSDKKTLMQLFDGLYGFGTVRIGGFLQAVLEAERLAREAEEPKQKKPRLT
jgi:hypothetical protein